MTRNHELKCWPEYFNAIFMGKKHFEIRKNDRPFKVGDYLILKEWLPETKEYTGNQIARRINYILDGGQFGIESGYIVMSIG